jgi:hypothetical protein
MGNAFGSPAAVAFCRRIVGKRSRDSAPSTSVEEIQSFHPHHCATAHALHGIISTALSELALRA